MVRLGRVALVLVGILVVAVGGLYVTLGGGRRLEDRTGAAELPASALELVADLEYPPGNIAVAPDGRVFFTYHPDGDPPSQVMELVDGTAAAVPEPPSSRRINPSCRCASTGRIGCGRSTMRATGAANRASSRSTSRPTGSCTATTFRRTSPASCRC